MEKKKSLIIIVSAPSGSGKTTLIKGLQEKVKGIKRSVSYTTRKPRAAEQDKDDYLFVTEEEFRKKIKSGDFLEWEKNFGNYYGTPRAEFAEAVERGEDIILSIDVKGAGKVKELFPESISVFIMPPSAQELETRLKKRNTDQEKQISARLETAQKEMALADRYDYLIINENIDEAVEELGEIVRNERKNRRR